MTDEIELLPLPEVAYVNDEGLWEERYGPYSREEMQDYARANVAHATAALQAEVEALRAEVAEWKRVAAAQAELHGEAEARAERLAEALRRYGVHDETCTAMGGQGEARESRMVVLRRKQDGTPSVWCDPEIADLVQALNAGGVPTVASCSGHGFRPGSIALADGRWLVIAKDDDERRKIDTLFPVDINGSAQTEALRAEAEAKETDLWRCTVCGQVSTVGRCCGEETREPWRPIRRKDEEETMRIEAVADRAEQLEAEIEALRAERDALAAALEAAREDGWQPIETAPKDGSEVILFDPDYFQRSGFEGCYSAPRGNWLSSYGCPVKPTHWRPLPAPPAIDQARGKGVADEA